MAQFILIIFGLVLFINTVFEKWQVWEWLAKKGAEQRKSKFLYQLSGCRFCLLFHLSWILSLSGAFFIEFQPGLILVPFVVSGLTTLKK